LLTYLKNTWHTHLWHQHIFDMTLTFVYFTWHLYLWQQCFSDITATFMTPVFFRNNSNIYDISVFSDMTTSVFFSDMTYTFIVMSEKQWCYKCCCHVGKTCMPKCRCHEKNTLMSSMYMSCLRKNTNVMNVNVLSE
jgi:hypothetical protein